MDNNQYGQDTWQNGASQQNYTAPGQPQQGYGAPQQNYTAQGQPQQGYGAPQQNGMAQGQPQQGYGAPRQNYTAPGYQPYQGAPPQTYCAAPAGNGMNRPDNGRKGFAIASLILGLVALVSCSCGGGGICFYAADLWSLDGAAIVLVIALFGSLLAGLLGMIFGIVSCVRREQKRGMAVAGIVTSAVGLALSCIVWLYILLDSETDGVDDLDWYMQNVIQEQEGDAFAGRSFELDDGSAIYFMAGGDFLWYETDYDHSDNYYEGTYETRTGGEAIDYIDQELSWYQVTREDMEDYFWQNAGDSFYCEENFLYLELQTEYQMIEGQGDYNSNVRRYMGFYDEGYYDAANMDTANYVMFEEL